MRGRRAYHATSLILGGACIATNQLREIKRSTVTVQRRRGDDAALYAQNIRRSITLCGGCRNAHGAYSASGATRSYSAPVLRLRTGCVLLSHRGRGVFRRGELLA